MLSGMQYFSLILVLTFPLFTFAAGTVCDDSGVLNCGAYWGSLSSYLLIPWLLANRVFVRSLKTVFASLFFATISFLIVEGLQVPEVITMWVKVSFGQASGSWFFDPPEWMIAYGLIRIASVFIISLVCYWIFRCFWEREADS